MKNYLNYQYTLAPFFEPLLSGKNSVEIDLNQSSDFGILFRSSRNVESREFQFERLEFLKKHPEQLNIIAYVTRKLSSISELTMNDIECIMTYSEIIAGDYGEEPIAFFEKEVNTIEVEKILYYLVQKKHNNKREDYFESVLKNLFDNKVYFYFDKLKKKLYVSFVAEGTPRNKSIFNICKYFFADILLETEVRWRVYPAIIGITDYIIACEGEQLCGTII